MTRESRTFDFTSQIFAHC